MKIIKYIKKNDNKYIVYLDNNENYTLYDDTILKYELLLKKEISLEELDLLLKYNKELECYYKAIKYINKKMRCKKELIKYLKDYNNNIVDNTIKRLEKENILNEDRYIASYINDAINISNKGYLNIYKELINLGLNSDLIYKYLDMIEEEVWIKKAKYIINKKVMVAKNISTNSLKQKLDILLSGLGYKREIYKSLIDNIKLNDNDALIHDYNKIYKVLSRKYNGNDLNNRITKKLLSKGYSYDDIKKYIFD